MPKIRIIFKSTNFAHARFTVEFLSPAEAKGSLGLWTLGTRMPHRVIEKPVLQTLFNFKQSDNK